MRTFGPLSAITSKWSEREVEMSVSDRQDTLGHLADVAKSFATRNAERVRSLRNAGNLLDRDMWERIAATGWISMLVPEDLDGVGLGLDAVVIVTRRLGYAAFPEPFVAAGVLAPLVLSSAQDDDAEDRIAAVMAGELVAGVAWDGGARASAAGSLSGSTRFVGLAGADGYAVAARSDAGLGIFWVPADADGLTVSADRLADGSFSARLELDGVPGEQLLTPGDGDGEQALSAALDCARVALAGELVGIADAALELTLDYLRQRRQFGRPIGSFQALQHRAVDMWMARELAAAALESAVRVHVDQDSTPRERGLAAASAKGRAALAAPAVCGSALQLHGAIGFTDEYDLGLYLNRALALAPWLGNATESRGRWLELSGELS
jgi:alkylation response protein AidB-like acyl-CoA dehydrogenase